MSEEQKQEPSEKLPDIHTALDEHPDFRKVDDLLKKAARESRGLEPVTLPRCFIGDAAFYVAWYVLYAPEKISESSKNKLSQAKEVYEYLLAHPEQGVSKEYCEKILQGIAEIQQKL